MIDRLTGDLVKDLAWVLNWHGLDAATDLSDTELANYLLGTIAGLGLTSDPVQAAVDRAAANPGQTVYVGEHGPEITRSER